MMQLLDRVSTLVLPGMPVLLDVAIKSVAILILAAAAALLLRRASAGARHLAWFVGVAALLPLPILSVALPGWRVLPAWPPAAAAPVPIAIPAMPAPVTFAPERVADPLPMNGSPPAAAPPLQPDALQWPAVVTLAYSAGALLCLLPMGVGAACLCRTRRRAEEVTSGPLHALLDNCRAALGLRRPILLLRGGEHAMPMTWGACPCTPAKLLLPPSDWNASRTRAVLLHELAHIKRLDCSTQLVTQLVCALYWFNPLVWLAAKRMLIERERACDDLVLAVEPWGKASDYAEHLLEIARTLRSQLFSGYTAIAMARPGSLEGRLLAILDAKRNRRAVTTATACLALAIAAAVLVPVAMLKAEEEKAQGLQSQQPGKEKVEAELEASATEAQTPWSVVVQTALRSAQERVERLKGPIAEYEAIVQEGREADRRVFLQTHDVASLNQAMQDAQADVERLTRLMERVAHAPPTEEYLIARPEDLMTHLRARLFVEDLAAGKFNEAVEMFTPQMKQALPATALEQLWSTLAVVGGAFKGFDAPVAAPPEEGFAVVFVPARWENNRLRLKVVFDDQQRITGLWTVAETKDAAPEDDHAHGEEQLKEVARLASKINALNAQLKMVSDVREAERRKGVSDGHYLMRRMNTEIDSLQKQAEMLRTQWDALQQQQARMLQEERIAAADASIIRSSIRAEDLSPQNVEYRLQSGDRVQVIISWAETGAQETDVQLEINQNGKITLPHVGELDAANLKISALEAAIANAVEATKPGRVSTVSVIVLKAGGNTFTLIAEGEPGGTRPGIYLIPRQNFRILDAVAMAGGISGRTKRLDVIRTDEVEGKLVRRVIEVPWDKLVNGDMRYNIPIRQGDVIRVPEQVAGSLYLLGEVPRPGAFAVPGDTSLTLLQALASAGGVPRDTPLVLDLVRRDGRGQETRERGISIGQIMRGERPDVVLRPDDLVMVYTPNGALGADQLFLSPPGGDPGMAPEPGN